MPTQTKISGLREAFVFGVFGREAGALGVRIGQQRVLGFQAGELLGSGG